MCKFAIWNFEDEIDDLVERKGFTLPLHKVHLSLVV